MATFSKSEERILITNDIDFTNSEHFPREKVFSVIWLRIPQEKLESSISSFSKLLENPPEFEGNLITLYEDRFTVESIPPSLI
ncbi:hypothetical protein CMI42_04100 [Candidatus Pacearchaeota archaeon]|nr:hypothetical protein [Candidatus Pacearchaeota archaeon]